MRLICPNCGAQYEVDDQVIPDTGRDVQCSNCGHTWFQQPAHLDQELADELDQDLPAPENDGQDPDESDAEADDAPHGGDKPVPERRGLDPQIADVLREEAAHESEARRAENSGLETQPDLGLDEANAVAASRSAAARARMARMRGLDETSPEAVAAAATVAATGSRRDLLPDIEEINSTLRASQDREPEVEMIAEEPALIVEDPGRRRRGFRLGFGLMMLLVAGAVILYAFAPQIIAKFPASEPFLIDYIERANALRAQADSVIGDVVAKVGSLIGG
jgi:predicted Zn finger-like uncharacterized protein